MISLTQDETDLRIFALAIIIGVIFYRVKYNKYRNRDKRHDYEKSEDNIITNVNSNIKKIDSFKTKKSTMKDRNDNKLYGDEKIKV